MSFRITKRIATCYHRGPNVAALNWMQRTLDVGNGRISSFIKKQNRSPLGISIHGFPEFNDGGKQKSVDMKSIIAERESRKATLKFNSELVLKYDALIRKLGLYEIHWSCYLGNPNIPYFRDNITGDRQACLDLIAEIRNMPLQAKENRDNESYKNLASEVLIIIENKLCADLTQQKVAKSKILLSGQVPAVENGAPAPAREGIPLPPPQPQYFEQTFTAKQPITGGGGTQLSNADRSIMIEDAFYYRMKGTEEILKGKDAKAKLIDPDLFEKVGIVITQGRYFNKPFTEEQALANGIDPARDVAWTDNEMAEKLPGSGYGALKDAVEDAMETKSIIIASDHPEESGDKEDTPPGQKETPLPQVVPTASSPAAGGAPIEVPPGKGSGYSEFDDLRDGIGSAIPDKPGYQGPPPVQPPPENREEETRTPQPETSLEEASSEARTVIEDQGGLFGRGDGAASGGFPLQEESTIPAFVQPPEYSFASPEVGGGAVTERTPSTPPKASDLDDAARRALELEDLQVKADRKSQAGSGGMLRILTDVVKTAATSAAEKIKGKGKKDDLGMDEPGTLDDNLPVLPPAKEAPKLDANGRPVTIIRDSFHFYRLEVAWPKLGKGTNWEMKRVFPGDLLPTNVPTDALLEVFKGPEDKFLTKDELDAAAAVASIKSGSWYRLEKDVEVPEKPGELIEKHKMFLGSNVPPFIPLDALVEIFVIPETYPNHSFRGMCMSLKEIEEFGLDAEKVCGAGAHKAPAAKPEKQTSVSEVAEKPAGKPAAKARRARTVPPVRKIWPFCFYRVRGTNKIYYGDEAFSEWKKGELKLPELEEVGLVVDEYLPLCGKYVNWAEAAGLKSRQVRWTREQKK